MVTYSSILAWEIQWIEEPERLQSMGSQKSRTQQSDQTTTTIPTDRCNGDHSVLSDQLLHYSINALKDKVYLKEKKLKEKKTKCMSKSCDCYITYT